MKLRTGILAASAALVALGTWSCNRMHVRINGRDAGEWEDRVHLPAGETWQGVYFAAGRHVVIDGNVMGDVYAMGSEVEVNGKVDGDVIAAGGNVDVNGAVTEHIRAAGGTVTINGSVGKDVTVAGGQLNVGKEAVLGGNVMIAGGTERIGGTVSRNVYAAGGTLRLSGAVTGDVEFAGGTLDVTRAKAVGGKLNALVERRENVTLADSAVSGEVTISLQERTTHEPRHWVLGAWGFRTYAFATLLLGGLLFLLIFPETFTRMGAEVMQRPGQSIAWGLLVLFGVPIAFVLLCVTVLGIPLAFMLLFAYVMVLYASQMVFGVALGRRLMGMEGKRGIHLFLPFLVGLFVIYALELVPVVRPILMIAGLIAGSGAIVLALFSRRRAA